VRASREAGEPRRTPASIQVHRRPPTGALQATIVALHDPIAHGASWSEHGVEVLDIHAADHGDPTPEGSSPGGPLACTDHDLARVRSAVFDLHAAISRRPRLEGERLLLVASGIAAGGALIALGAGLSANAITDDPLRHELLLDLFEGDLLHERMVDDVAPRIAAAVLMDPRGAPDDWRDAALGRVTTPVAFIEHRGAATARRGFAAIGGGQRLHAHIPSREGLPHLLAALAAQPTAEVFERVVARPAAFGANAARHAHGALAEPWPMEAPRTGDAHNLVRNLWRITTHAWLRHDWSWVGPPAANLPEPHRWQGTAHPAGERDGGSG